MTADAQGTQGYGSVFARVYDQRWSDFAVRHAPAIRALYEASPAAEEHRSLLDVACGTGHLCEHFLAQGYRVTGIDLSPGMLEHARRRNADAIREGRATFVLGDASRFRVEGTFGLAVSTFDALNHLPDLAALAGCFRSVRAALAPEGLFVFDLNTRKGLVERWNGVTVTDTEDLLMVVRAVYDGGERAVTRITGFVRRDDGGYDRFSEVAHNTAFPLTVVAGALREAGFAGVHAASGEDLARPVKDPEALGRAFLVARAG